MGNKQLKKINTKQKQKNKLNKGYKQVTHIKVLHTFFLISA